MSEIQVSESSFGYSAVIERKDGSRFVAAAPHGIGPLSRAYFVKHRDAVAFKRELVAHGMKAHVTRVRVTIETL